MKRAIYLIILSAITVFCVIYSVVRDSGGDFSLNGNRIWGTAQSTDVNLDNFDSIVIDADVMEILLKKGTGYTMSYSCNKKCEPQYHVENGKLYIEQNNNAKLLRQIKCNMIITVPESAKLELVDAKVDVGDITFSGVDTEEYRLTTDVGEIKINNANINKAVINTSVGDIDIERCEFANLDIKSDVGDVNIKSRKDISEYSLDLKVDLGEISVNGEDHSQQYKVNGNKCQVKVENSMGDISLDY